MKRCLWTAMFALAMAGCGDDDDDVAHPKAPMTLEQVPPVVMAAAKKTAPDLTFFAAARDTFKGKESIELRGKTKTGQVKEIEIAPDGTVLGYD